MPRALFVLSSALLAAAPVLADDAPPAPVPAQGAPVEAQEPLPELQEEIVIKGRTPTRVETLEAREVRETPAHDLGEALSHRGLAASTRKGGIASDVVVRGFQREAVAITIDGARLHGACPNRMDPPAFHVDYAEVDRVELRKGPYDVASPGGLGATIDVRTRDPRAGASGELNLGYGSFDSMEASGTVGWGADRFGLLAGGALKQGKPFESGDALRFTEVYPATSTNRYRAVALGQDAYGVLTAWAKGTWTPAPGHRAELSYAYQAADDVLYPYLKMDARYDDTNRVNAAYEVRDLGLLSRLRGQAYFSHVLHDMDDANRCSSAAGATPAEVAACGVPLPRGWSMRTLAESWVVGGVLEAVIPSRGETTAGVDLSLRGWNGETTRYRRMGTPGYFTEDSLPDVSVVDVGLRAAHEVAVGRVTLRGGVRLDLARSEPGDDRRVEYARFFADLPADLRRDDVLLSGNLQADVRITSALTAFAGYGHGARLPDPQERYFALSGSGTGATAMAGTVGYPGLDPVLNDELDVGAKLVLGPLLVKAQVFRSWLTDWITVVDAPQLADPTLAHSKTWANVSATMWGGEASARVLLPWDLHVTASLAYTEGRNETAGTWLAEIPPLRATAALRYDVQRWFAEVETVMADDQRSVDRTVNELPTAGWAILNLKAGVQLGGARIYGGVRNLFDRSYFESLSHLRDPFASGVRVPEPGRILYANGQYAF